MTRELSDIIDKITCMICYSSPIEDDWDRCNYIMYNMCNTCTTIICKICFKKVDIKCIICNRTRQLPISFNEELRDSFNSIFDYPSPPPSVIYSRPLSLLRYPLNMMYGNYIRHEAYRFDNEQQEHSQRIHYTFDMLIRVIRLDNKTELKRVLDEKLYDPTVNNNEPLKFACRIGQTDIVKLLLEYTDEFGNNPVNPGVSQNDPLRSACRNGHTSTVKLLLEDDRVNPTDKNNEPIRLASRYGNLEIIKLLLLYEKIRNSILIKVDPSAVRNQCIQWAARQGFISIVELLIDHPDVNYKDRDNRAYEWAKKFERTEIVELFERYDNL